MVSRHFLKWNICIQWRKEEFLRFTHVQVTLEQLRKLINYYIEFFEQQNILKMIGFFFFFVFLFIFFFCFVFLFLFCFVLFCFLLLFLFFVFCLFVCLFLKFKGLCGHKLGSYHFLWNLKVVNILKYLGKISWSLQELKFWETCNPYVRRVKNIS